MPRPISGWRPSTPPITSNTFDQIAGEHSAIAIHFWAEWNGSDPRFDVSIQSLPEGIRSKIYFVSCNIDDPANKEICLRFKVSSIPYLGILVDGKRRDGIVGLRKPAELETALEARLRSPEKASWWALWHRAK